MLIEFIGLVLADALLILLFITVGDALLKSRMPDAALLRRLLFGVPALIPGFFVLMSHMGPMAAAIATLVAVPIVGLVVFFLDRLAARQSATHPPRDIFE